MTEPSAREREDRSVHITLSNLSGFHYVCGPDEPMPPNDFLSAINEFVRLYITTARAEERERCVAIADEQADHYIHINCRDGVDCAETIATRIRSGQ